MLITKRAKLRIEFYGTFGTTLKLNLQYILTGSAIVRFIK